MRVLIAHPYKLLADALSCLLSSQDDVEIVGICADASRLPEEVGRLRPDAVVLFAGFLDPGEEGLIRAVREASESSGVVVVSNGAAGKESVWVFEAGASGCLGLDCSGIQFIDALRRVVAGEVVLLGVDRKPAGGNGSPDGLAPNDPQASSRLKSLTSREREVLALLSRGFSNREIAESLFLSHHTVRTHVQNLRAKLDVRSKFQAAMLVMQAGVWPNGGNGIRF